jgi:host factor-I protein
MSNLVLQDIILNQLRRDKSPAKIVVSSGTEITGVVKGFDSYTLILDLDNGGQIMIYKHNLISVYTENAILVSNKIEK